MRLATPTDIPQIAELAHRDASWTRSVRTRLTRGQLDVLVAGEAAEPTGYAIFQPRRIPPSPARGWRGCLDLLRPSRAMADPASLLQPVQIVTLQEVFVRPDCRLRGIGTALMSHGLEHAHSSGIDDIRVHLTAAEYAQLQPFYERLGLVPSQVYLSTVLTANHAQETSRPATHRDIEPLAMLLRDAIHHQQTLTSAFQLRTDINCQGHTKAKLTHPDFHLQVIEQDGHLAAFAELRLIRRSARPWRPAPAPHYGVVQEVYVAPQLRRRGLASMLLRDAHRWFSAQDITHIRAAIWQENHGSLKLFQDIGYEIDERVLRRVGSTI